VLTVRRKKLSPPKKIGDLKHDTFGRFSTSSRLNGEYLRNETRAQSGKEVGNYEVSATSCRNFMKFGPQTA